MQTIINYAPTGMLPNKENNKNVPISINEIIEDVHEACELGITMVHLHARDEDTSKPTYKADTYAKIIEGIRKISPELIVCVSLSGRDFFRFEERSEVLHLEGGLKPDMGSLTLSSLNFPKTASVNEPEMIKKLALLMNEKGILPELEVFDLGMVQYAKYLEQKNIIKAPHYFNLFFGNCSGVQVNLLHAGMILNDLPPDSLWSFGGIGKEQFPINALSIAIGGGVRVGLEDNLWLDAERTKLASNMELLNRIHELLEIHNSSCLSSKALRKKLNLQNGFGKYGRRV